MAVAFSDVNLVNLDAIRVRIAAPNATSRIEVRKGSKTGQLLGSANVPNTGGFQSWGYVDVPIIDPGETFDLFLVFRGASGYLYNLNWIDFVGAGRRRGPADGRSADRDGRARPPRTARRGWYTTPVEVTLTSEAAREYRIGTGAWTTYTTPVRFATDGVYRLDYRARKDGLPSAGRSLELKLDQTAPATTAALEGLTSGDTFTGAVRVTLTAADADVRRGRDAVADGRGDRAARLHRGVHAAEGRRASGRSSTARSTPPATPRRGSAPRSASPEGIKPTVTLEWPKAGRRRAGVGQDPVPGRGRPAARARAATTSRCACC